VALKLRIDTFPLEQFPHLLEIINTSMPALLHLTWDFEVCLPDEPLELPILRQLHEFFYASFDNIEDRLGHSLRRFALPNGELRAVGLQRSYPNINTPFALEIDPVLAHKFTHYYLGEPSPEELTTFCRRFTSLTFLRLS